MRYDFTKVQYEIELRGKKLRELQALTGLHFTTISKAISSGHANQTTAIRLVDWAGLSMKDILIKGNGGIRREADTGKNSRGTKTLQKKRMQPGRRSRARAL